MPNNKRKRVSKIKGKDKAHPYSRKAQQIARAMSKEAQIAQTKGERVTVAMGRGQKAAWFRDRIKEEDLVDHRTWSRDALAALVREYLDRNADEVAELQAKAAAGRPLPVRESLLVQNDRAERQEAAVSGIDVPDLTNGAVVRALRAWDGDLNSISAIKLTRCKPTEPSKEETASSGDVASSEDAAAAAAIAQATGMAVE